MFFDTKDLKTDEIYLKLDRVSEANIEKRWVDAYHFKICLVSDDTEVGNCDFRVVIQKNYILVEILVIMFMNNTGGIIMQEKLVS